MKKQDFVTDEVDALLSNFETLKEVNDVFKNC